LEGAVTLPSIIFAETNPQGKIIERIVDDRSKREVEDIIEKIRKSSALDECMEIARDFSKKASEQLQILPDNEYRRALSGLVDYMLERKK
jgi:geranylgeranyl pyrophosphate synthase